MIYINTKITLKPKKCHEMHDLICAFHGLSTSLQKYMTTIDEGFILSDEGILAYHIEDGNIYDYIYEEKSHQLMILTDMKNEDDYLSLFDYLLDQELVVYPHPYDMPLWVEDVSQIVTKPLTLPIVYLHKKDGDESLAKKLALRLKGKAYVYQGNEAMDQELMKHYPFAKKSFALLFNHDYMRLGRKKNESDEQYMVSIERQLHTYHVKRVYDYPFSMNQLHQEMLVKKVKDEEEKTLDLASELDYRVDVLEQKYKQLVNDIERLENEINKIKIQNDILQARIDTKEMHPVLFKEEMEEFYTDEQKSMVLILVEDRLFDIKDKPGYDKEIELLKRILENNPYAHKGQALLKDIERILMRNKSVNDHDLEDLRRLGIQLATDPNDHFTGTFFGKTRYTLTVSCSSGDINAGRQCYRTIRKYCF